ncbi:hypothetical protein B7P33_04350 [Sediminicola luteus]|uniref:Uncharacterized protein n=1 Tax=Sediminicola luteus TaxID=319238 RepID=A0A2A4GEV0_9FLAO|nr:hypothetical protein B7P33_04350 [Sediminicola luteus]
MVKRNLSSVLIILAMLLHVLNFDFSTFSWQSKSTWFFLAALILIVASAWGIFKNEKEQK